ncbi:MAG: anthranilate phosphoribosyltransferase [Planctomycetota bacterium]|nr:anthranilate phosphoribosyltransferase [Planctomycetota bacterium]
MQKTIQKLIDGHDLSTEEATAAMNTIMEGKATDAQIAGFLVALRLKGETVSEITGCATVMREKATRVNAGDGISVDTCGTGGDVSHTFNISTAAAFIVAGAGIKVAKHGNRSVSSKSGSADVLATLGVNLDADVPTVERCIAEANIGFLFAPKMHAAMKYAIGPRRELGVRTIFNVLGPLTNPAGAKHQVIGVFDKSLTERLANVLGELGSTHALVVHGLEGLDEVSTTGPTQVSELKDGETSTYEITPEQFGIKRVPLARLQVEDAEQSAELIRTLLDGETGPAADIACMNAGAAIYAADQAVDLAGGLAAARESVASGAAKNALAKLVEVSQG